MDGNVIKFSSEYEKLVSREGGKQIFGEEALLLFVEKLNLENQSLALIEFDTRTVSKEHYPLPEKGMYLLLLFKCNGLVFFTLRPFNAEKAAFYRGKIGQFFTIEKS